MRYFRKGTIRGVSLPLFSCRHQQYYIRFILDFVYKYVCNYLVSKLLCNASLGNRAGKCRDLFLYRLTYSYTK